MARRTDLLNKITRQLAVLACEIELMNRSNRMTLNSDAETIFCGLINRLEGWDLRNLNEVAQNYPGIDLADPGRRVAVQITASASQKKVDHTLEVFFRNKMERSFDRLVLVIITDRTAPTMAHGVRQGFKFDPKRDIWNIEWFKRRVEAEEDAEQLQAVADYLDSQLGDLPGEVKRPVHLLPPVPAASEFFLEGSRDEELAIFQKALEKGAPVFIWGLGGMGKTQTAIALARRCEPPRGAYFLRYTIPADPDREAMWETIRRADLSGYVLDAGAETDPGVLMEREYREKLEILRREYADTLLVIDNFDWPGRSVETLKAERSYQDVAALDANLVFTTRYPADPAWEIRPLPAERLLELMRKSCADYDDEGLLELIRAVGGHTLMVDLMAKTLEESWNTVTPEQILVALKNAALNMADFPEVTSDKDGLFAQAQIYRHLQALFNLSGLNDVAKKVLSFATLIAREGLDDWLFLESLPAAGKKELQNLVKRGWLRREDHVVTIHPAVEQVCRSELKPEQTALWDFLDALWAGQEKRKRTDTALRRVAVCLEAGAALLRSSEKKLESKRRAMSLWELVLPADHPDLARVYSEIGVLYGYWGMSDTALRYKQKSLTIKKNHLPEDDPVLAASLQDTGKAYAAAEQYEMAVEYGRRGLEIMERLLPPDHPDLADFYDNMVYIFVKMGDTRQELSHKLRAVEIRERTLPPDHPLLVGDYSLLSLIYARLEEPWKALEYEKKALEVFARIPSADPLELGGLYEHISVSCERVGAYAMALGYLEKALAAYGKHVSDGHPFITSAKRRIAAVKERMN